jgi:hypothetical protein
MHARADIVARDHADLVHRAFAQLHTLVLNSVSLLKIAFHLHGDKACKLDLYTLPISASNIFK